MNKFNKQTLENKIHKTSLNHKFLSNCIDIKASFQHFLKNKIN